MQHSRTDAPFCQIQSGYTAYYTSPGPTLDKHRSLHWGWRNTFKLGRSARTKVTAYCNVNTMCAKQCTPFVSLCHVVYQVSAYQIWCICCKPCVPGPCRSQSLCTWPLLSPSPDHQASVGHQPCALALVCRSAKHTVLLGISPCHVAVPSQRSKKPAGLCNENAHQRCPAVAAAVAEYTQRHTTGQHG